MRVKPRVCNPTTVAGGSRSAWRGRGASATSAAPGAATPDEAGDEPYLTVASDRLEGRLPELVLTMDRKRWLHTFMTAEGQPRWAIRLHDDAWLGVNRGHLYRQGREPEWKSGAGSTS